MAGIGSFRRRKTKCPMKMNSTPICNGALRGHSSKTSRRDYDMPGSSSIKGQETPSTRTAGFLTTTSGCSEVVFWETGLSIKSADDPMLMTEAQFTDIRRTDRFSGELV